jgi:hypothetical protein
MSQFWQKRQPRLQPCRAEGEHATARVEVIQRLLLDRIDAEACTATIGHQHHLPTAVLPHETEGALALLDPASSRTQRADHAVSVGMPPATDLSLVVGHVHALRHLLEVLPPPVYGRTSDTSLPCRSTTRRANARNASVIESDTPASQALPDERRRAEYARRSSARRAAARQRSRFESGDR